MSNISHLYDDHVFSDDYPKDHKKIPYRGWWFRSKLEVRWAMFFDKCGIEWTFEPQRYDLYNLWDGNSLRDTCYMPDFRITIPGIFDGQDEEYFFEVKGSFPKEEKDKEGKGPIRLHNVMSIFSKQRQTVPIILAVGDLPETDTLYYRNGSRKQRMIIYKGGDALGLCNFYVCHKCRSFKKLVINTSHASPKDFCFNCGLISTLVPPHKQMEEAKKSPFRFQPGDDGF